jgi:hypothetical protein
MLKMGNNHKNIECGLIDFNEFSLDDVVSSTNSATDNNSGKLICSYDFEKSTGSAKLSGVSMGGISDSFTFNLGAKASSTYVVNTFLHFERNINIGANGVFVRD